MKNIFMPAKMLLPKVLDMTRWSVIACDQYTSEPGYWQQISKLVGTSPSTLKLILPELYLERKDIHLTINSIHKEMQKYLDNGIFDETKPGYIYVERTLKNGKLRRGLLGLIDLEEYDFSPGSSSPVRATEGTVIERIPPRAAVRRGAPLELPHIMLLVDDPCLTLIEPMSDMQLKQIYNFPLMENSGHLKGYFADSETFEHVERSISNLWNTAKNKGPAGSSPVLFAVGDGNHSLATAKTCWQEIKSTLTETASAIHPARYALVELVNLHDGSLDFEPIHRVVFNTDPEALLNAFKKFFSPHSIGTDEIQYITSNCRGSLAISSHFFGTVTDALQQFLDDYLLSHSGKLDYIHGDDTARTMASQPGNVGFILPPIQKSGFFDAITANGPLPRKTFSMGHAYDKRFYLECRRILPE